jgi:hypothetical protein
MGPYGQPVAATGKSFLEAKGIIETHEFDWVYSNHSKKKCNDEKLTAETISKIYTWYNYKCNSHIDCHSQVLNIHALISK